MPDKRKHRGPHPRDKSLFAGSAQQRALRLATRDLSWLLTRGYKDTSALALVGNRYDLRERQRRAVLRCSAADEALAGRAARELAVEALAGREVALDGFNCVITVEAALSGGLVLIGRDGCLRDLSSIHGTYRAVSETPRAIVLLGEHLAASQPAAVHWLLDRPVSNSGRLKVLLAEIAEQHGWSFNIELHNNPDRQLAAGEAVVASSDAWVLDSCSQWTNLLAHVVRSSVPDAWCLDLGRAPSR